jgi:catalase
MSSSNPGVPEQIVDVQRTLAGKHPGFRPVHAKGIVVTGTFEATVEARKMSRAVHFQGAITPVVVRFANANGDPNVIDTVPNVRSMSVKFSLPGDKSADLLANSIDGFLARTPEDFLEFLKLNLPDPATGKPDPAAVPNYLQKHPEAAAFIGRIGQKPIPASYAQAAYHAVHAFLFTASDGSTRYGRYHWVPDAGELWLTPDGASKLEPQFLLAELAARLAKGPVTFTLTLQIANPGDPTHDATILWPADRKVVKLGRLTLTEISPTGAADERKLIFDPTHITDGISLSDDPIPLARAKAYSKSYAERTQA